MKFKDDNKEKAFQKFLKHFPKTNDVTLLILKGHLLAEEEINELLNIFLRNYGELKKTDLTFFQRLCLLKAILPKEVHQTLKEVECLNSLRNKIAHNLEPKGFNDSVEVFLAEVESKDIPLEERKKIPIAERLTSGIARLCGGLSGFKIGFEAH